MDGLPRDPHGRWREPGAARAGDTDGRKEGSPPSRQGAFDAQTALYQVRPEGVDRVKAVVAEFVGYVSGHEPEAGCMRRGRTRTTQTRFVHLFVFDDDAAHQALGTSDAVRRLEEVYNPVLAAWPVVFSDYDLVAASID